MFGVGPLYALMLYPRFVPKNARPRVRNSVVATNVALVLAIGAMCWLIGWQAYLLIQLPVAWLAATAGVWLFYVQHQFEGVAWARTGNWLHRDAALLGSSYYDLPGLLRWISGNIGIHHIHHLNSRIPYYRLPRVLRDFPELKTVGRLTFWGSFKGVRLSLWCEERKMLVSFKAARWR
jgi:omega-6 fatty acid desaturase (delta-12 desaturase)